MSKPTKKAVNLELPANLIRWATAAAKRQGVTMDTFVSNLMQGEKEGRFCLDVDIVTRPDGKTQIDVFPDGWGAVKVVADSKEQALAELEKGIAATRRRWNLWRLNRAWTAPGFNVVSWEQVTCKPTTPRLQTL